MNLTFEGACCDTLVLSHDHCLACFYDGYEGVYKRQSQFYHNVQKNLVNQMFYFRLFYIGFMICNNRFRGGAVLSF